MNKKIRFLIILKQLSKGIGLATQGHAQYTFDEDRKRSAEKQLQCDDLLALLPVNFLSNRVFLSTNNKTKRKIQIFSAHLRYGLIASR